MARTARAPSARPRAKDAAGSATSALLTGVLLGIGVAGFVDEAVFHQILQWHNFYWATDQQGRILSDGLFHVFSTLALLWGAIRLWRDRLSWSPKRARRIAGALLIGAGGFNTYDGVVQHVILHLHLVNEHLCAVPYSADNSVATCPADVPLEIAWIAVGSLIVAAGVLVYRRGRGTVRRA